MATALPSSFDFEGLDASANISDSGIANVTVTYYCSSESEAVSKLISGETCPLLGILLTSAIFKFGTMTMLLKDKAYEVKLNWRGLAKSFNLDDTIVTNYKPVGQTEPIATHPYFNDFAGSWANRKIDISNPDFDGTGSFVKFHKYLPNGDRNPFAGIESFYQSGLIVSDSRVAQAKSSEQRDQYDVGKISEPEADNLPSIYTEGSGIQQKPRNYLLISVTIEDLNNGYILVTREWQMSGPKGWDTDIYEYEDPDT